MAKILIVDDEKLARITIRKMLERAGHEIVEAATGVEGIGSFKAGQFDLVMTDIIMPDMEGIEMIAELRRIAPDVRILAASGGGRTRNLDFLKLAQEHGARRVLAKPFSQDDLVTAVRDVLAEP